jgi:hypothetical protein
MVCDGSNGLTVVGVVCGLVVAGVVAVGCGVGRAAGAAPPAATAGITTPRNAIVVGTVTTGAWPVIVVVDRAGAFESARRVIFFADTATDVGDGSVVDDETATLRAVVGCEPPHATVKTMNAPTTA